MKIKLNNVILGVLLLFAVKYLVIGVNQWNAWFHPTRVE